MLTWVSTNIFYALKNKFKKTKSIFRKRYTKKGSSGIFTIQPDIHFLVTDINWKKCKFHHAK